MNTKAEGRRMKDESIVHSNPVGQTFLSASRGGVEVIPDLPTPCEASRRASTSRRRRRGVGLVEMLIALAISAALLTATAVAIDASFKAYSINQEQSDLMQRSRLAMYRMTTMLRQTKLHAPHTSTLAGNFAGGATVTDTGIDMFDLNGQAISYTYDAANKKLIATVGGMPHVMCEGVEGFTVRMEPMRSAESIKTGGAWDLLKRASLQLTVKTTSGTALVGEGEGKQTVTLSASVMPRRNNW